MKINKKSLNYTTSLLTLNEANIFLPTYVHTRGTLTMHRE